jgi:hypothetical protein
LMSLFPDAFSLPVHFENIIQYWNHESLNKHTY